MPAESTYKGASTLPTHSQRVIEVVLKNYCGRFAFLMFSNIVSLSYGKR